MADRKNTTIQEIPKGFCQCGCGERTRIPSRNFKLRGWIKGEPLRFIHGHNSNGETNPAWNGGRLIDKDGYVLIYSPNHPNKSKHRYVREHILIAEKAIGKLLPPGVVVHHANAIKGDNFGANLVVCQDEQYHRFIEMRLRAFRTCGHASWLLCQFCGQYDDPGNMYVKVAHSKGYHLDCSNKYQRERRKIKNEAKQVTNN